MKILLTGGTGYIGSHTAVVLSTAGHEVTLLDNLCNSKNSVVDSINTITKKKVSLEVADVRDTEHVSKILFERSIDAVIHFAGLKAVGDSVKNPLEYFDTNITGTLSLLKAMKLQNIKKIVFSSSATVYGNPEILPLQENHSTITTNPYGRSKLHTEEILKDLTLSDNEWRVAILRYFNPVGAHQSGLIGENPNGLPNNLMPYISKVAKGDLPYLNVWGNDYPTDDGTGVRDYIHIMDLAEGHLAALNYLQSTHRIYDIFNLGTGQGVSVLEMVRAYELACGHSIPIKISSRREGDIAACWANPQKANKGLNWYAVRNLAEMCHSAWKYVQINS